MRIRIFLGGLAAVLISSTGFAAGVAIQPGLWEMTSTMTMTMLNQPQTNTVKQCIEEDQLDPDSFNMEQDTTCKTSDVVIDGNTARWSIDCPTEMGTAMTGQWEFTSAGDSITGSGTMSSEYNGQQFGFEMTWSGKRIGDCE